MAHTTEKPPFNPDKASRYYSIIAILSVVLIVAAAELHIYISGRQDGFLETLVYKFSTMCNAKQLTEDMGALVAAAKKDIELLNNILFGVYAAMLVLLICAERMLFQPALARVRELKKNLEHMSTTDLLTGQYTRASLFKVANMLINGAKRHKHPLAVLAVDIDDFKAINDKRGRIVGDAAIKTVALALAEALRTSDALGRVGGEEFAVFLPNTDEYRANYVAEKLRKTIEELNFGVGGVPVFLRVSIGIAEINHDVHKTPDDMLRAAEVALQHAKATGRNRVVAFGSLATGQPPKA